MQTSQKVSFGLFVLILAAAIGGGLIFAHRNVRLGRGDRRGATRIAVVVLVLLTISWILSATPCGDDLGIGSFSYVDGRESLQCRYPLGGLFGTGTIRPETMAANLGVVDPTFIRRVAGPARWA